jgi:hypothetical protein
MPNVSPSAIELTDHGIVEVGEFELGDYTVDCLTVKQPFDMSLMLKGLPDDACQCPHWGVVTAGSLSVRYISDGHVDTIKTGDVFYMPPGHVPTYEVGTRLTQFSPTDQLKATDAAIQRNMAELHAT